MSLALQDRPGAGFPTAVGLDVVGARRQDAPAATSVVLATSSFIRRAHGASCRSSQETNTSLNALESSTGQASPRHTAGHSASTPVLRASPELRLAPFLGITDSGLVACVWNGYRVFILATSHRTMWYSKYLSCTEYHKPEMI